MEPEDILAHYGVPGMKWGKRKAEGSGPSERQQKRAQYKEDLAGAKAAKKSGTEMSESQAKALKTNGQRKVIAGMAIYGGIQLASYAVSNSIVNNMTKNFEAAANAGTQATNSSLKQVGDLSTFVLRQGANGSWG